jgi:hypothetical protein
MMGNSQNEELAGWTRAAIAAGLTACFSYPLMVYVPLPRLVQVTLGAAFGPALALASISLGHVLQAHRRAPSIELAGIANALAGALVTGMIIVQLAINYSTAPRGRTQRHPDRTSGTSSSARRGLTPSGLATLLAGTPTDRQLANSSAGPGRSWRSSCSGGPTSTSSPIRRGSTGSRRSGSSPACGTWRW